MIVDSTILELTKRFMFQFDYKKIRLNLKLELLYSDTDSFFMT